MGIFSRLFKKSGDKDIFIFNLPSDSPGIGVILKALYVEAKLDEMSPKLTAAGLGHSREQQIVAIAAFAAKLPIIEIHSLLKDQKDGIDLVQRVSDCRELFTNSDLSPDWNVPGYLVTLFRITQ